MYKIFGGDGKEYGPITTETLRQWIAEGRANAETQVLPEGAPAWVALGTLPEFADAFGGVAALASVPIGDTDDAQRAALSLAVPPAWALIVTGALGVLFSIGLGVYYIVKGVPPNPFLDQYFSKHGGGDGPQKIGAFIGAIISVAWAAFIVFAGLKLRKLESWGLVLTAGIICLIPCCGTQLPICLLSFPIGVWVIIILCLPKVKSQFT